MIEVALLILLGMVGAVIYAAAIALALGLDPPRPEQPRRARPQANRHGFAHATWQIEELSPENAQPGMTSCQELPKTGSSRA